VAQFLTCVEIIDKDRSLLSTARLKHKCTFLNNFRSNQFSCHGLGCWLLIEFTVLMPRNRSNAVNASKKVYIMHAVNVGQEV
jgi:hypothetical protein